ncbi:hypothetical protein THASP1DRAFT_33805 [Thamnocephalis sphaerospora]|uniref:BTB domain-containing protein n=1 Tax=Thamnocephalis sphaerospora TaxID=78915 RepID=A0A4P9XGX4_9FUNG|nr:hypothetical protein THASP1DRAFT_33805 [Thamnocephalis sphaerospora]|eukprot:RKP04430.1 hypothetical protein THASP1DRAFT_33805 [Thamnocephalis sphaerospora]
MGRGEWTSAFLLNTHGFTLTSPMRHRTNATATSAEDTSRGKESCYSSADVPASTSLAQDGSTRKRCLDFTIRVAIDSDMQLPTRVFRACSAELIQQSDYFAAMLTSPSLFAEQTQEEVTLVLGPLENAFPALLAYVHAEQVEVTLSQLAMLHMLADRLQMPQLMAAIEAEAAARSVSIKVLMYMYLADQTVDVMFAQVNMVDRITNMPLSDVEQRLLEPGNCPVVYFLLLLRLTYAWHT